MAMATIQAYYRLLNCGFRPGFAAGTDYPCGISELGALLTYVQVAGGVMTYRNWIDGIADGRTVISRNGHNEFLDLTVNGNATPGDEINLTGAGSVPVTVTWTAIQNLTGTMELVRNGVVVASQTASVAPGSSATLTATVNFTKSGWLAARRMSSQRASGAYWRRICDGKQRADTGECGGCQLLCSLDGQPAGQDVARRGMELIFFRQNWLRPRPGIRRRRRSISRLPWKRPGR